MKNQLLGTTGLSVSTIVLGCMRISEKTPSEVNRLIHCAVDHGINMFDHADIYGGGKCEELFGRAMQGDPSLRREDIVLQSKCAIKPGMYDFSKEHILASVDHSLQRLQTDYLDVLLLHRPDALMEPEEVAEAFDLLQSSGKVRHFGVSNHKPSQIALLKTCVKQDLSINQLQFSLAVSNMVANGMEVNMTSEGSFDHDDSVLDYSRIHHTTIQAWSPMQMPNWQGCFIGSARYEKLNAELNAVSEKYEVTPTAVATAWILRHPAKIQVIAGTVSESRLMEMRSGAEIRLTREEWYRLYLASGHILP